jgi:hypothetical protein
MDRVLTWHFPKGGDKSQPAYYMETDYQPSAVRIYAEKAPAAGDCQVDIFDDGVSIFNDTATVRPYFSSTVRYSKDAASTYVILPQGDNAEVDAEDFTGNPIEAGSWVTCVLGTTGGAENVTVHLELTRMDEDDETTE